MGEELARNFPASRQVFETADRVLGQSLSELCFRGDERELSLTENTQPAVLTVSVAALRALQSLGLGPVAAAAGHSLGEYTAHVAAGSLSFEDALRVVRLRGRFMQEAVPVGVGAMAAILGLELPAVETLCREARQDQIVSPANLNGPGQIVIAGHAAAVERAMQAAREAGAQRAVPLPVSAPFHCALMQPAAARLRPLLDELPLQDPAFPVFSNVDAEPVTRAAAIRDALWRQTSSPVRWHELVSAMAAAGIEQFLELGPGKVLAGLLRRIDRRLHVISVGDAAGVAAAAELFREARA
jgi:[acyl-carrier-protein] S-malonyltransferase